MAAANTFRPNVRYSDYVVDVPRTITNLSTSYHFSELLGIVSILIFEARNPCFFPFVTFRLKSKIYLAFIHTF